MRAILSIFSAAGLALMFGMVQPACAGDGTILGTGLGAAIGGLFGSQFGHGTSQVVNTSIGIAAGGLIGNTIGQDIDNEDRYAERPVAIYSTPSPVAYAYAPNYVAPPSPPPIYVDQESGSYCREYSQEIRINGHLQENYGTACLQPDGSWRIVN